jgi:hypothetical protein
MRQILNEKAAGNGEQHLSWKLVDDAIDQEFLF